ncbi:MAG: hypothetical protein ABSG37_08665 [Candidatus Limnocylindrales bacterium]
MNDDERGNAADFGAALEAVGAFSGPGLTAYVARLERELSGMEHDRIAETLAVQGLRDSTLEAALMVKRAAAQIDVVVHALGIALALPHILEQGERIESLSLGAGNTGRDHDLVTDRRIAEFKFVQWRGGPESIRQNRLFVDLFNLVSDPSPKRKELYVVDKATPLRFLTGGRAVDSVLSRDAHAAQRFANMYGSRYATVGEYYSAVRDDVQIIDLAEILPAFAAITCSTRKAGG